MYMASACGLLLIALLYYGLIISPAMSERKKLISRIADRGSDLQQMKALKNEWESFQGMRKEAEQRLARKGQSFTLLSFLETISRAVGVDKKIQYMKPLSLPHEEGDLRPEGIEMSLDQMNMKELVTFLYRIEYSGKLLHIKRIKIQKSSKDRTIKVTLQVTSYSKA
jgi:hypothetical protein